jgi:S1-C subfamily serine protease
MHVGEYKSDQMHGQGTYTFADGSKYIGEFRNSVSQGHGSGILTNGSIYVGEYRGGKPNGQGTFTYANGNKYVGEWKGGKRSGFGTFTHANGSVLEGIWENDQFKYARKPAPIVTGKKPPPQAKRYPHTSKKSNPSRKSGSSGSGFFISKLGHVITNQHVVDRCKSVTVGDSAKKQITASVLETDRRNDLALLRISSLELASAQTKSLVAKLGISITPLASQGLLRPESVELGKDVVVAGFPFGDDFSSSIKITKGVVSAKRGAGDNTGQFQLDAAVQPGNSGGPIYDENGSIIGVVVSQLNKFKFVKEKGAIPENVNFGIKASTVNQFLNASGRRPHPPHHL